MRIEGQSSVASENYKESALVESIFATNFESPSSPSVQLWSRLMADKTMGGERDHDGASVTCWSVCAAAWQWVERGSTMEMSGD
ncbi:unnamed protein product [Linum trigynum]|uniref:Uncharacterized protein n=1 Tax=Linum trigynum TaxID=586398 RepID=A0AAV2GUI0_9ROSI